MAAISWGTLTLTSSSRQHAPIVTLGETCSAGDWVYRASGKVYKANNNEDAAHKAIVGMVLTGGSADASALMAQDGDTVTSSGTPLTADTTYYLGSTGGQTIPDGDVATGDTIIVVGVADSSTVFRIAIANSGVAHT